jgi:hypothetical protein
VLKPGCCVADGSSLKRPVLGYPTDYESSMLEDAQSRLWLPKRETDHHRRTQLDRVLAMITI